jgi:hypothetical protein
MCPDFCGACRRGRLVIAKCDLVRWFMAAICGYRMWIGLQRVGKSHKLMAGYDVGQWVGDSCSGVCDFGWSIWTIGCVI